MRGLRGATGRPPSGREAAGDAGHGDGAGQGHLAGPGQKGYLTKPPAAAFSSGSGLDILRT